MGKEALIKKKFEIYVLEKETPRTTNWKWFYRTNSNDDFLIKIDEIVRDLPEAKFMIHINRKAK